MEQSCEEKCQSGTNTENAQSNQGVSEPDISKREHALVEEEKGELIKHDRDLKCRCLEEQSLGLSALRSKLSRRKYVYPDQSLYLGRLDG